MYAVYCGIFLTNDSQSHMKNSFNRHLRPTKSSGCCFRISAALVTLFSLVFLYAPLNGVFTITNPIDMHKKPN